MIEAAHRSPGRPARPDGSEHLAIEPVIDARRHAGGGGRSPEARRTMPQTIELRDGHIGLFGYGSLLLKSSMERTLARPYEGAPIVGRVDGWRRTWNAITPNDRFFYLEDGQKRFPASIIYLNVVPDPGSINGLIYVIDAEDLPGFDRREFTYSRVDVRGRLDVAVEGGPVWMYVGKPPYLFVPPASQREAAVRRSYLRIVDSGLAELGRDFRIEYDRSTDPPPADNVVDDLTE
ncbi:MAG TPA: gamma-glutamylcyclotransferase family protein [Vicinamibacterales bacterium]|jgi:cation transport regulator ChaC